VQELEPAKLYALSPHSVHTVLAAVLSVPGGHFSTVLVPSQMLPAGQLVHVSRVVEEPPDVNDGLGQATQLPAPAAE